MARLGEQNLFGRVALNPNADGEPVPRGLGPAPFRPSQPEGRDRSPIVLPGANFPPADAIPVDQINSANISEGTTVILSTIVVPDTYTFRVKGIGFGAGDESGLRFLSWSLFTDPPNNPVTGYVNQPAGIGSIPQLSEVFLCVGSSVTVTLRATNNAPVPATYQYLARIQGWFYREVRR